MSGNRSWLLEASVDTWVWIVVVLVVLAVVAAVAWTAARRRQERAARSAALREQFGPEYDRTLLARDNADAAEQELLDRRRRHDRLTIVPLAEPARERYAQQWRDIQARFVDRPADAVAQGHSLLQTVMLERGYPLDDIEGGAELVSVDHPHVIENYRVAHDVFERSRAQSTSTEELRGALLKYRSLFEELLAPPASGGGAPGNAGGGRHRANWDEPSR